MFFYWNVTNNLLGEYYYSEEYRLVCIYVLCVHMQQKTNSYAYILYCAHTCVHVSACVYMYVCACVSKYAHEWTCWKLWRTKIITMIAQWRKFASMAPMTHNICTLLYRRTKQHTHSSSASLNKEIQRNDSYSWISSNISYFISINSIVV